MKARDRTLRTEFAFLLFQMCERLDWSLKALAIRSRIVGAIAHVCTMIWGGGRVVFLE